MKAKHRALLLPWAGGDSSYTAKVKGTATANLIAYWPLAESSGATATNEEGTVARNGTYTNGPTLGQAGIGDGRTAVLFDGSNDFVNIYSASFNTAFNGQLFTIAGWFKIPNWANVGQQLGMRLRVDASNDVYFDKFSANIFRVNYVSQGQALKTIAKSSISPAGFFHFAATVNKAADELIGYYNGTAIAAASTGLGAWAGNLASTGCCISAGSTVPANALSGTIAHVAVWSTALTAAQILSLATVP